MAATTQAAKKTADYSHLAAELRAASELKPNQSSPIRRIAMVAGVLLILGPSGFMLKTPLLATLGHSRKADVRPVENQSIQPDPQTDQIASLDPQENSGNQAKIPKKVETSSRMGPDEALNLASSTPHRERTTEPKGQEKTSAKDQDDPDELPQQSTSQVQESIVSSSVGPTATSVLSGKTQDQLSATGIWKSVEKAWLNSDKLSTPPNTISAQSHPSTILEVDRLIEQIRDLESELSEIQQILVRVEQTQTDLKSQLSQPASPSSLTMDSFEVNQAITRFHNGQFAEALDLFETLGDQEPKDPRFWYYAALCRGFATHQWQELTEAWIQKAVQLERQSDLQSTTIDLLIADFPEEGGKAWINYYRDQTLNR